jgi:autophagy-related protein 18
MGYFGKALMTPANYLPSQMTEVFTQGRAFAVAKLPSAGQRNICALAVINKLPRILVASADGYLYIYNLDPSDGQECPMLRQFPLKPNEDEPSNFPETEQQFSGGLAFSSAQRSPSPSASCSPPQNSECPAEPNLRLADDNEYPPLTVRNE